MRLVMPPSVSIPLSVLFCWGFVAVMGATAGYVFGAAFLAGYLAYDMTHFHVHHHKPRTRLGKMLRELHMRHHFQDHTRGFGVSAPFWDVVFGTRLKRRAPAR
jgi:sterol desaturase/sphingolipid hydroxylase (fatty acid hydroxylase superfamily)